MHGSQAPSDRTLCTSRFADPFRTYQCKENLWSQVRPVGLALLIRGRSRAALIARRPLREQPRRIESEG